MSQNDIIKAFTGDQFKVSLLKNILEQKEIQSMIRDDYQSGMAADFFGGTPSSIDLYINESDVEKAKPVIEEFLKTNQ